MILIEENFLPNQDCDAIKNTAIANSEQFRSFRDMSVLDIKLADPVLSQKLGFLYCNYLGTKNIRAFPELLQFTFWPPGSLQNSHFDDTRDTTILTSITYLNDDYEGGQTYFKNGVVVNPKKGKTVFFDGKKYKHGVSKIIQGNRYVCAFWYTNKINNLDC